MRPTAWLKAILLIAAIAGGTGIAEAQWPVAALALRTNGAAFRAGDCVRLDVLPLEAVNGPLAFRPTYRYTEPVVLKDSEGKEQTVQRERTIDRPAGPPIDALDAFQTVPIDDRFCFGERSVPGRYLIDVALVTPGSGVVATLHTCVSFGDPGSAQAGCAPSLSGVVRVDGPGSLVFDGTFSSSALYRVAVLREREVLALIDGGASVLGPHQLSLSAPELRQLSGQTVDLLLHDQANGASTTLGRVTLPVRQE